MRRFSLLAAALSLLVSAPLHALNYIEYTDRTAWESSVSGIETEDFNAEAVADFAVSRVFAHFTATNLSEVNTTGVRSGGDPTNIDGTNFLFARFGGGSNCSNDDGLEIVFDVPVTGFGFDWKNTDGSGDLAEVVIVIDGEVIPFGPAQESGFFGIAADGEFDTIEIQDQQGQGGCILQNLGIDNFSLAATVEGTARFKVTKTFSDGNDAEVDVTLTCNTGLPLEQTFTIAGGDPEGVTFVVTEIPESGADCVVTESGAPAGYTTKLNGGDGCAWEDVTLGTRNCEITNEADPATYTVYKDFTVFREGGDVVLGEAFVTIKCDSAIAGEDQADDDYWYKTGSLSDGETLVATVDTTEGPATCSATESIIESGVEQSAVGCGATVLPAGGSHTCTFTNTVFFEGIPTLSQYGLAVLVLLTLGVGFVGLRRFV